MATALADELRDEGFVVLRNVFSSADVAAMQAETQALLARDDLKSKNNLRVRWTQHVDREEALFELFDPVFDIAPECRRCALGPAFTERLAALLGGEVCLFKDKLIYKPPGATGYPIHQDFMTWPDFPESFTTAVIAIDGAGADSGCLELYPRAHAKGYLSERDGNFHVLELDDLPVREKRLVPLAPGDVAVFGAFMPHGSGPNRSASSRRHLFISYNKKKSDGGDLRRSHYEAFHHYLRSVYSAFGLGDLYFK